MSIKKVHASGEELTVNILIELLRTMPREAVIHEATLTTGHIFIKYELKEDDCNVRRDESAEEKE